MIAQMLAPAPRVEAEDPHRKPPDGARDAVEPLKI